MNHDDLVSAAKYTVAFVLLFDSVWMSASAVVLVDCNNVVGLYQKSSFCIIIFHNVSLNDWSMSPSPLMPLPPYHHSILSKKWQPFRPLVVVTTIVVRLECAIVFLFQMVVAVRQPNASVLVDYAMEAIARYELIARFSFLSLSNREVLVDVPMS